MDIFVSGLLAFVIAVELNTQWYYVFYVPKDSVVESFNFS